MLSNGEDRMFTQDTALNGCGDCRGHHNPREHCLI
jgi:hypothetical protein